MPQALSQVLRQEIWQQRGKGAEIGAIAEVLGISRRSVTRILARGGRGLKPSYDRCGRNGREYREGVRTAAVALKRAHPGWGAVVIQLELAQEFGKTERLPGERTLQSWFRRAGVAVRRERKPAETRPRGQWVHEVWEVDAKEQVTLGDHSRASVLMMVDEASGALVAATSFPPRAIQCRTCSRHPQRATGDVRALRAPGGGARRQRGAVGETPKHAQLVSVVVGRVGDQGPMDSARLSQRQSPD